MHKGSSGSSGSSSSSRSGSGGGGQQPGGSGQGPSGSGHGAGPPPPAGSSSQALPEASKAPAATLALRVVSAMGLNPSVYPKARVRVNVASPSTLQARAAVVSKLQGSSTQGAAAAGSGGVSTALLTGAVGLVLGPEWTRSEVSLSTPVQREQGKPLPVAHTCSVPVAPRDVVLVQVRDTGGTSLGHTILLPEWFVQPDSELCRLWADALPGDGTMGTPGMPTVAGPSGTPLIERPLASPPQAAAAAGTLRMSGVLSKGVTSSKGDLARALQRSEQSEGKAATSAAANGLVARVVVMPHFHTKWCDRKRQVCTAGGDVRELNRLGVLVAGVKEGTPIKVRWFRSTGQTGDASTAPAPAAAAQGGGPRPPPAAPPSMPGRMHEETGLQFTRAPVLAPSEKANSAHWPPGAAPLDALPLFDVPNAPTLLAGDKAGKAKAAAQDVALFRSNKPAADGSTPNSSLCIAWPAAVLPGHPQLQGKLAGAASPSYGIVPPDRVLHDSPASLGLLQAEVAEVRRDASLYFLRRADVGSAIMAVVTAGGEEAVSQVVGPVQPAPPAAREVWISGQPAVGNTLQAHVYYVGGEPGPCQLSWITVSAEGDRTTTEPQEVDLSVEPEEGDPRLWKVLPEHVGCIFKVTCDPIRSDGVTGAGSTSRPTAEVSAE